MLNIGEYIKIILQKRNITLTKLAEMMTEYEKKNGSTNTIYRTHLSAEFNAGAITIERARKIEIALKLPEFQLVHLVKHNLSPKEEERLRKIYIKR
jgi:transcriptional regulator with XRE-family HTH domain